MTIDICFVSVRPLRQKNFDSILSHVRLPLLSPYFLHDVVEKCSVVKTSPECQSLVEEAKLYHLLPDRRNALSNERTRPRRNAGVARVIVSVGGEDDKVVLRSVEYYDPLINHWKQLSCLPFAVSKHGLVVSGNNKMYMAGGEYPDGSASRALWRYDPVLNSWHEMAPMQTPRSELGLAMLDGFYTRWADGRDRLGEKSGILILIKGSVHTWNKVGHIYLGCKKKHLIHFGQMSINY